MRRVCSSCWLAASGNACWSWRGGREKNGFNSSTAFFGHKIAEAAACAQSNTQITILLTGEPEKTSTGSWFTSPAKNAEHYWRDAGATKAIEFLASPALRE